MYYRSSSFLMQSIFADVFKSIKRVHRKYTIYVLYTYIYFHFLSVLSTPCQNTAILFSCHFSALVLNLPLINITIIIDVTVPL
jgi:hypothetical protein